MEGEGDEPGGPGGLSVVPVGLDSEHFSEAAVDANEDGGAEEEEAAGGPASMGRELTLDGGLPGFGHGEGGGESEEREAEGGERAVFRVEGHPESAGGDDEEDIEGLDAAGIAVSAGETRAETVAHEEQSQSEGERAGEDVGIEGPLIEAVEVVFASVEEIGIEVGWEVVGVFEESAEDNFDDDQGGE